MKATEYSNRGYANWFLVILLCALAVGATVVGQKSGAASSAVSLSLTLDPVSVLGSKNSPATIALGSAAPAGGAKITLTSSTPSVASVPASVKIPAGAKAKTFAIDTEAVRSVTIVDITATYQSARTTARLTINPPQLTSFNVNPGNITEQCEATTGKLALTAKAPAGGVVINLNSRNPVVSVPSSVTVPAGSNSTTFPITASQASTRTVVEIVATPADPNFGSSLSDFLRVKPNRVESLTLTANPAPELSPVQGTVTLRCAAGPGGVAVTLKSNKVATAAPAAANILIAEGSNTGTFEVLTKDVTTASTARIRAKANGRSKAVVLTVDPAIDTQAPTVSLAANPVAITAPAVTVLTAIASDNVGVVKVEFLRGSTVIASDNTAVDGFNASVSLTNADVGTATFAARAFDAAGNSTESAAAGVTVNFPTNLNWGPPGTPLPPGAQVISLDELAGLSRQEGFEFITHAGLDGAIARQQARVTAAKNLIDGLAATDPSLAYLVPPTPVESDSVRRMADGNYLVTMGNEQQIVHGTDWLYQSIAASIKRTPSRANREANYRSLIDLLPDDQKIDLPSSDALSRLSDQALEAANRELVRRVEVFVPNQPLELPSESPLQHHKPMGLSVNPGTGCKHQPDGIYEKLDWPLKAYTTRPRNQGTRATCVAQAIIGAMEVRIWKTLGLKSDYSEQELYARAKGSWFPTSNAYGDGLNSEDVLDELSNRETKIDSETRWSYNQSRDRYDDQDHTYTHSCDNYEEYCSNTNHQKKVVCSSGPDPSCGTLLPSGVQGEGHDPAQLDNWVSLWNSFEPENSLAAIRAHLNGGHPVVFEFLADDNFEDASHRIPQVEGGGVAPGVITADGGGEASGGHAVLIVGYLSNGEIPEGVAAPAAVGGGYLIAKNSWGCGGDGGYMYLPYEWLIDQAYGAYAVLNVQTTAIAPKVTSLTIDKSQLNEPGHVKLTVKVNRSTTKVTIYQGQGVGHPILNKDFDGGQNETATAEDGFIDSGQNGNYIYWALARDQGGNAATSNAVGVIVNIDDADPQIQLTAESTEVDAPGTVRLHAVASDNVGVTRVKFYRSQQLIGEDTTAPYSLDHVLSIHDIGPNNYRAVAFDAAGNHKATPVLTVNATSNIAPFIFAFSATPSSLPIGGGTAVLSWIVAGANKVAINKGIGDVATQGSTTVNITQGTTYTLTATNVPGTITRDVFIPVQIQVPPIIQSFTATPSSLPLGGGTTSLSWHVLGSGVTLSIDNGIGNVTGLTQTPATVSTTTTYRLTATNGGGTSTRDVTVSVLPPPPTIASFTVSPDSLPAGGGHAALSWSVNGADTLSIDQGIGDVTSLTSKPVSVGQTTTYRLTATNAGGSTTRDVTVSVALSPPMINSFTATPATLPTGGGQTTLAWLISGQDLTVTIDQGVGDVSTLHARTVSLTTTTTYQLTASNSAGSVTANVTVIVAVSNPDSVYVSPSGNDANNNCQLESAPCKTIARGVSQASANGTVWLLDGDYTESSCAACTEIIVPTGLTLRSKNPGRARIGNKLLMTGGTLAEVVIDRSIGFGRVRLTGGTTALEGVRWRGLFAGQAPANVGLDISGSAIATLVPGAAANYAAETVSQPSVANIYLIEVRDTARLTIQGGLFEGPGVGAASQGAFVVANSAVLTLSEVTLRTINRAIVITHSGTVNISDTTIEAVAMNASGWGIRVSNNATDMAQIVIQDSEITGFVDTSSQTAAITVATAGGNHSTANISLTDTTLSDNGVGIYIDSFSSATIQGNGLFIDDNQLGAIRAVGSTNVDINDGSLSRNGFSQVGVLYGGMTLGSGSNHIKLRNVEIMDNKNPLANGNTDGNSGLTLAGDATSTFDLGTAADPGGNTITGNTTVGTTGVDVKVNAVTTVSCVGNVFMPNNQGTDSFGRYQLGVFPCSATSCEVVGDAGQNFRVTSGKLRLAGN